MFQLCVANSHWHQKEHKTVHRWRFSSLFRYLFCCWPFACVVMCRTHAPSQMATACSPTWQEPLSLITSISLLMTTPLTATSTTSAETRLSRKVSSNRCPMVLCTSALTRVTLHLAEEEILFDCNLRSLGLVASSSWTFPTCLLVVVLGLHGNVF